MAIDNGSFPMQFAIGDDNTVARWRPLVHWLLAIPHFIVGYALNIVAQVLTVISWFMILFTGKMNEGMANIIIMSQRYNLRATSFFLGLTEEYPPFTFDTTAQDPGGYPVTYSVQPQLEDRNRATVLFRIIMLIPLIIVMYIYMIVASIVMFIAWFAVLITGKYPPGLRNLTYGFSNFSNRLGAYGSLLTDQYPSFGLTS